MPLGLESRCNIRPLYHASINKAVNSVPCCCVLREDSISGLAMQGKPVALSRGATTIGIRARLTVGHAHVGVLCYGVPLRRPFTAA